MRKQRSTYIFYVKKKGSSKQPFQPLFLGALDIPIILDWSTSTLRGGIMGTSDVHDADLTLGLLTLSATPGGL